MPKECTEKQLKLAGNFLLKGSGVQCDDIKCYEPPDLQRFEFTLM